MIIKSFAKLAVLMCICFTVAAIWLYIIDEDVMAHTPDAPLSIISEREIGYIPVGKSLISFAVSNPAHRPRRIIASIGTCSATGCLGVDEEGPILLEPGVTHQLACKLIVPKPGPFEIHTTIYVDDKGLRPIILTARGIALAQEVPIVSTKIPAP